MDSTDQYLRINNLEIVGLDNPGENESVENLILECLNGLNLENEVVSADIDICHALPSKKHNDQKTHIVRFISRKSKSNILSVNKEQRNRLYRFRNGKIFINEHLTPTNKHLFALAKQKKNAASSNTYGLEMVVC